MDLTDDELELTRLAKGLLNMESLKKLEQKYKEKPKIINKVEFVDSIKKEDDAEGQEELPFLNE